MGFKVAEDLLEYFGGKISCWVESLHFLVRDGDDQPRVTGRGKSCSPCRSRASVQMLVVKSVFPRGQIFRIDGLKIHYHSN